MTRLLQAATPRLAGLATVLALSVVLFACNDESNPGAPTSTPLSDETSQPTLPPSSLPTQPPLEEPTLRPPPPPGTTGCERPALEIVRGDPGRNVVALTFDAGADAGYTLEILDTLRAEGIKAGFGITGVWAEENPSLVAAIAAGGHLLMNHSYDHPSFTGLSTGMAPLTREERIDQLQRADAVIRAAAGVTSRPYFRAPFGDTDISVLCDIADAGYLYAVRWTVDTLGWNGASAEAIVQRAVANAQPGAVYIMHVGSESADGVALPQLIAALRAEGYSFGTVAEILP